MSDIEKVLDKVRKLLALSTSANEHEAASAAAKAAELMREHQIEEAQLRVEDTAEEASPIVREAIETGFAKKIHWRATLASGCAASVGAKVYWSGPRLNMFGRINDIRTATYLYKAMANEIERLSDSTQNTTREYRHAFRLGAADVISSRLRDQRKKFDNQDAVAGTALALVKKDSAEVDNMWKDALKNMKAGAGPSINSGAGYAAGRTAGASVALGGGKAIGAPDKQLT